MTQQPTRPQGGTNGMAASALALGILGVLGVLFAGWLGLLTGAIGVVLGIIALRRSKRLGSGRKMAIAGIALGGITLLLYVLGLIVYVHQRNDCRDRIGHEPTPSEVTQCVRDKADSR